MTDSVIAILAFAYYNARMVKRLLGAGAVLLVAFGCSGATSAANPSPSPAAPHGWTMVAHASVGLTPGPITLGGRWAFVANMGQGTVSQLDRAGGRVVATIQVVDPHTLRAQGCAPDSVHAYYSGSWGWRMCDAPYAIAWDGTSLWALDNGNRQLVRVDPAAHRVTGTLAIPGTGWSLAIAGGVAYVSGMADNHALYSVDLASGVVRTTDDLDTGPASLVADATGVWVACVRAGTGRLDRVDPHTMQVTGRYPIEWWSTAVAAAGGSVFVRGTFGGDISRLDVSSGKTAWTAPGPGFIGRQGIDEMGAVSDGIWMSGPTTSRVDLASGQVVDRIPMPSETVAADGGEVWLVELNGSIAKFQLK